MNAAIRLATEDDEHGILECLRLAFEPFRSFYSAEGFADTTLTSESFRKRLQHSTIFVAEIDNCIVGTIACSRVSHDEGHLRGMAVLPTMHGRGIAQQLLDTAENTIRGWGCTRVTLDTTKPLQRAIHFYEANGYRATGKVEDFYGLPLYEYAKPLE
jgi:predicted N-acetyltransferase YhbS